MATLQKTFECLTCKQDIKLARKEDNSGWDKFNLDGSPHVHPPKKNQQHAQIQTLADEVGELKAQIKILISQVQMLRSDCKELKERKDK
jgi:cell division protein FtsB